MKYLTLAARLPELERAMAFIEEELLAAGCPDRARLQLALAAEEVFVNIASYAYPEAYGTVCLALSVSGRPPAATLTFTDSGQPYNPLDQPEPDLGLTAAARDIGGLGIYLVRQNVDSLCYQFVDGKNVLTLKKAF